MLGLLTNHRMRLGMGEVAVPSAAGAVVGAVVISTCRRAAATSLIIGVARPFNEHAPPRAA